MGIAKPSMGPIIAETMKELGRSRALVVHGAGTDEIAVHGETEVWELRDGEITNFRISPAELGVSTHALEDLRGGDGVENARFMRATFAGRGPAAHRDAVAVNAGAMFYLAGISNTMREGTERALSMLTDGSVETWQRTHEEADYRD